MTAPVFTWPMAVGATMDMKPRVLLAKYGDGYEQRVPDGINTELEVWSGTVNSKNEVSGVSQAEAFLRTQGATTAFQWTTPTGRTALFVCRSWKRAPEPAAVGFSKVAAQFEEVPA